MRTVFGTETTVACSVQMCMWMSFNVRSECVKMLVRCFQVEEGARLVTSLDLVNFVVH